MTWRHWATVPPGTSAPVFGSTPSCPVTNSQSPTRTAWLYAAVGGGGGAAGKFRNASSMGASSEREISVPPRLALLLLVGSADSPAGRRASQGAEIWASDSPARDGRRGRPP